MNDGPDDLMLMRSAALQNAQSILLARQRAEDELLEAKRDLELKTEQLAQSLATIRATLESTTDGILAADNRCRITAFNQRFVDMLRLTSEQMSSGDSAEIARHISAQFNSPARFLDRLAKIEASFEPESADVLELADGRVLERFSQIQYVNGAANGRVWSFRDITQRRQAELALIEEKRVLALLNDTGAMLASKLHLQELLQAVTDAATEITGARFGAFFYNSVDEHGERYILYTLSGAPREAFEKLGKPRPTGLLGQTFDGGSPIRCDDVLTDPRYGRFGPHHGMPPGHLPVRSYLAVPVVSGTSEVFGGLLFGHPEPGMFTERVQNVVVAIASQAAVAIDNARLYAAARQAAAERERLLESERAARAEAELHSSMKDDFLGTLSHELRTPLGAILGWAQILRRGARAPHDLERGLETIERNARVQAQLIEDLLDMSRINSGTVRLDLQPISPLVAVNAAIEALQPAAAAKDISIEQVGEAAGSVSGDPNRLQQIVWNLLANAIKFTPQFGLVQVKVEAVDESIAITVSDSGAGIDPAFLPRVFDRFRQADGSSTRSYGGLGLGLSIVKSLTELHGGTVTAHSPGLGLGATFTVLLPRFRADHNLSDMAIEEPPGAFMPVDLSGLTVLVLDDEEDARELLKRMLEDCDATVLMAACAEEALQLLAQRKPDVLIGDIGMPHVDGHEFIRRVRLLDSAQGGRTPAIALTAFARSEDRIRALRAGYQAHVAKPVDPSELVATVASVAGR